MNMSFWHLNSPTDRCILWVGKTAMQELKRGDVCYHKATNKKCVVIKLNEDGTIKVRNADDEERDYHPVELRPEGSAIVHKKKGYLY